jgi:hypothetical protein
MTTTNDRLQQEQSVALGEAIDQVDSPDLDEAERFLKRLDPSAVAFTFQTFDDNPDRKDETLAAHTHGSLSRYHSWLARKQAAGAGVFVTVNKTDGKGRREHNITHVRAVFADLDGPPLEPVKACGLAPHMIIESSPGRWQAYWLVSDLPLTQFEGVQRSIANRFGGDNVVDLPRVMRLPGFLHQKGEPFRVRAEITDAAPYTAEQVLAEFPPVAKPSASAAEWFDEEGHILEGRRDTTMASIAGRLRDIGLSIEEIHASLQAINEARCVPPLDDDDLQRIARSIGRYEAGLLDPTLLFQPILTADEQLADMLGIEMPKASQSKPRLYFELFDQINPGDLSRPALIQGLLDVGAMSVVYGESGAGKTFWALDISFHIGQGKPWRGLTVTPGTVVYVAAEGGHGIKKRIKAYRQRHEITGVPFALAPCSVDLCSKNADTGPLIELIKNAAKTTGQPVALVVIDTLARAMAGKNENDSQDMGAFVGNIDHVRTASGAHVMIVHHTGKDRAKGARGHSSLRAATDTEIELEKGVAKVTKQRDLESAGQQFAFSLESVDIGSDASGARVTSCVVKQIDGVCVFSPIEPTGQPKAALDALRKLLADNNNVSVNEAEWRHACHVARLSSSDKRKTQQTAFGRARDMLLKDLHVEKSTDGQRFSIPVFGGDIGDKTATCRQMSPGA